MISFRAIKPMPGVARCHTGAQERGLSSSSDRRIAARNAVHCRAEAMRELSEILRQSTSGIGERFFRLPIDGGDSVYRERVYCYELYHQMRSRWPQECPFCLNGEVDKRAHPFWRQTGLDEVTPDFLVHGP